MAACPIGWCPNAYIVSLPADLAAHPALAPIYGTSDFIVHAIYRRYGGWYDGNPSHLHPSTSAAIATEVLMLAGADALLLRAQTLIAAGTSQLGLHLLDFLIDGTQDPAIVRNAKRLKSKALHTLADNESSFITQSILTISAERLAHEADE